MYLILTANVNRLPLSSGICGTPWKFFCISMTMGGVGAGDGGGHLVECKICVVSITPKALSSSLSCCQS